MIDIMPTKEWKGFVVSRYPMGAIMFVSNLGLDYTGRSLTHLLITSQTVQKYTFWNWNITLTKGESKINSTRNYDPKEEKNIIFVTK